MEERVLFKTMLKHFVVLVVCAKESFVVFDFDRLTRINVMGLIWVQIVCKGKSADEKSRHWGGGGLFVNESVLKKYF